MDSKIVWSLSGIKLTLFLYFFVQIRKIACLDVADNNNTEINIALNKPTFQSSQFDESSSSDLAVDDNDTTCSHTTDQKDANWTIDLGDVFPISQVKINTGGTYFGPNLELYVSNVFYVNGGGMLCNYGTDKPKDEYVISCFSGAVSARSITIKNRFSGSSGGVKLCNVQVLICKDGYFDVGCLKECRCHNNSLCEKINGQCPGNLCAAGWNGTNCQTECENGSYGPSCQGTCHCLNGTFCNKVTGHCDLGCAQHWVGPSCRTEIPRLMTPPTKFSATTTEIKIMWHSWIGYVDQTIKLLYQIQYKLNDFHGNDTWKEGPLKEDTDHFNEEASVTGLMRNSFYDFRIVPILQMNSNERVIGEMSPKGILFRTKCSLPETTNITKVYSWVDTTRNTPIAVLSVEWVPLTQAQSNCENILFYEIFYQKRGSEWKKTGAKKSESAKNITSEVQFASEYWVRIVAHNNHPYESSSNTVEVITPPEPELVVHKSASQNLAIIVGVIVCVGLLFALILAFILYRNIRQKTMKYHKHKDHMNSAGPLMTNSLRMYPLIDDYMEDDLPFVPTRYLADNSQKKKNKTKPSPKRPPIKVEDLEKYIMSRQNNESEELRKEYREIPEGNNDATTVFGEKIDNRYKNRFVNIIPYDHSRVVLKVKDDDPNSDYINSSYLDGYKKPKAYIASQGCNKLTTQDFWRMVWEEDSHRIVMVTNLVEKGKIKCEQYWPDEYNVERWFHDLSVVLTDVEKTADFVMRTLDLRKGDEIRNIKQLHYTTWPDHGVPARAGPIIAFRRKVRALDESHPGVIVVHCSAGVGRTGAFVALDYLLDEAKAEGQVDVFGLTCQMRKDRGNMIQTVEQYFFVYNALLEALKSGNTVISCSEFKDVYERMCQVDLIKGKSPLEEQFELLQSMSANSKVEECLLGAQPENQDKNRFSAILPADKHRPYLMTRVQGTNDYINAVFLDGYRSRNAYIITQMPLPHTVIDLWRLIFEHKCGTIVMLNPRDDHEESYGQYWPEENEECECGPFIIEIISIINPTPDIVLRKLKLCYNPNPTSTNSTRDPGPRMINHFQLLNWNTEDSIPSSPSSLVSIIDMVEQSQKKTGNNPVVLHCCDGVTQSGLYATVSCILERLKDEQEVDVFQTIKHLRYFRKQIIQEMEQYKFCHEMVLTYLADFATYSNFR